MNIKEIINSKYYRTTRTIFQDLSKGTEIMEHNGQKVVVNSLVNREDLNKFQVKLNQENENDLNKISLEELKQMKEYSCQIEVKIIVINYLNKMFNINIHFPPFVTLELIKNRICDMYNCDKDNIEIIYQNKKLTKNQLETYVVSDLKNENSFTIYFIQLKPKSLFLETSRSPGGVTIQRNSNKKCVLIINVPISIHSFYLSRPRYESGYLEIHKFNIYEIDENPIKYKVNEISRKKGDSRYKLPDNFFTNKYENCIFSYENIFSEYADISNDDELESTQNKLKYKELETSELIFLTEKIYLIDISCSGHDSITVERYSNKYTEMFELEDNEITLDIILENKVKECLIGGLNFTRISLFEL